MGLHDSMTKGMKTEEHLYFLDMLTEMWTKILLPNSNCFMILHFRLCSRHEGGGEVIMSGEKWWVAIGRRILQLGHTIVSTIGPSLPHIVRMFNLSDGFDDRVIGTKSYWLRNQTFFAKQSDKGTFGPTNCDVIWANAEITQSYCQGWECSICFAPQQGSW